jgi:hypothetical protein
MYGQPSYGNPMMSMGQPGYMAQPIMPPPMMPPPAPPQTIVVVGNKK